MSSQSTETHKIQKDTLSWFLIAFLIIGGVAANVYFAYIPWGIRAAIGILVIAFVCLLIAFTEKGRLFFTFIQGSRLELRKVIWPTKQEMIQTTLLVIAMIVVVALILWGIDALFFWAMRPLST